MLQGREVHKMEFKKDPKNNSIQPLLKHILPFRFGNAGDSADAVEEEIASIIKAYGGRDKALELKLSDSELFTHLLEQVRFNADISCREELSKEHIIGSHIARELKQVGFEFDPDNPLHAGSEILKETLRKAKVRISDYQLFLFESGVGFLTVSLQLEGLEQVEEFMELSNYLKSISRQNRKCGTGVCRRLVKTLLLGKEDYRPGEEPGYNAGYPVMGKGCKLWLKNSTDYADRDIKIICRDNAGSYELVENVSQKLLYGEFIDALLEPVGHKSYFNVFTSENGELLPAKALVMGSAVIHKTEQDSRKSLMKNLLRISRGYHQRYELRAEDVREGDIQEQNGIYLPFDNVCWAYSREGIGNIIIDEDDCSAPEFLISDFTQRLDRSYLVLYILSLHQYYGLIHLSDQASKLPFNVRCYSDIDDSRCNENYEKLKRLREKVYFFHLKCVFEEVSHITHQAYFYRGILQVLGIRNMIEELDFEMKKVSEIASLIREEELERLEEERKQRELEREKLEKERLLRENEQRKLEEKREQDKKLLLDMMASGGGIVGFFILYDNVAKMVQYLKLAELLHMRWFSPYEINEAILTVFIISTLLIIGVVVYRIRKFLGKKKKH
jgi:hypothetical protein